MHGTNSTRMETAAEHFMGKRNTAQDGGKRGPGLFCGHIPKTAVLFLSLTRLGSETHDVLARLTTKSA